MALFFLFCCPLVGNFLNKYPIGIFKHKPEITKFGTENFVNEAL